MEYFKQISPKAFDKGTSKLLQLHITTICQLHCNITVRGPTDFSLTALINYYFYKQLLSCTLRSHLKSYYYSLHTTSISDFLGGQKKLLSL